MKSKKIKLSLFIISSFILVIYSCNKNEIIEANVKNEFGSIPPGGTGGNRLEKNYCVGCGTSNQPSEFCYWESLDIHDNPQPICGTPPTIGEVCPLLIINNDISSGDTLPLGGGYESRDSLLIEYVKGQRYISYYYQIGHVMHSKNAITAQNLLSHISFANKCLNASETLLHGNDNDIPFNSNFKSDAISMINYYRTLDSTLVFNNTLDSMLVDLDTYTNLTRSQVLNRLANGN